MFPVLARNALREKGIQVVGGIMSPTHDNFKSTKPTLISSVHRLAMVERSVAGSSLVKCSSWEAEQDGWTRTLPVLQHHGRQIAEALTGQSGPFSHLPDMSGCNEQPR